MDKITLIDEQDNVLGSLDKYETHKYPAKLHRAISVWIVSEDDEILLQKRSKGKIVGADWWGNAVCGNVRFNESYLECAVRRLREEIGVVIKEEGLKELYSFRYKAHCNSEYGENELDHVFLVKVNKDEFKLKLNSSEVSEVVWIKKEKLMQVVQEQKKKLRVDDNYEYIKKTLKMSLDELKEKTKPIKMLINNKQELLAPWSWMMLMDERLKF